MLLCGSCRASTSAAVLEVPFFHPCCVGVAGSSSCLEQSLIFVSVQVFAICTDGVTAKLSTKFIKVRSSSCPLMFGMNFFHDLGCLFHPHTILERDVITRPSVLSPLLLSDCVQPNSTFQRFISFEGVFLAKHHISLRFPSLALY